MPEAKPQITLEDFVRISTSSALDVLREQGKLGDLKFPRGSCGG
jgi:hypothetical protein